MQFASSRFSSHIVGLLLLLTVGTAFGETNMTHAWPQWRGPNRDGQVPGADWPGQLAGAALTQQWRVELGPSYSGPVVVGDRVFVTETKDKKWEVVRALSRSTGKQLWEAEWEGSMSVPFFARSNGSWIRSTPAYDDGRLYVGGIRDVLVCLEASTGKQIWRVDFVKQLKTEAPSFGFVCSPLIHGDHVYVQAGASFVKMEKTTGKIVWRSLKDTGGMSGSAFSSPSIATIGGVEQFVVQTRTTLAGVDPETGTELWSQKIPAFRGMNILTPTTFGDAVFTSAYGGKSLLHRLSKDGGEFQIKQLWKNKTQGYMSSPVIVDGHAYLHLRNQRLTCIDLASGEIKWTTKPYGKYWSLVTNGDLILALDERGDLLLIRANPDKFELLDTRKVSDQQTWAHLGIRGDEIFIRELNAMTVFRWSKEAASPAEK